MEQDLDQTIEDAVNDAVAPEEVVEEVPEVEASAETSTPEEVTPEAESTDDGVVKSPAATDAEDPFTKKFGISAQSVTGRENRIPYSRVKKIVEKNEKDTIARITKELEEKFTPQTTELTSKVAEYEERLGRVAQFEQIMENDPRQFLGMLSQLPAYKGFFDYVMQAAQGGMAQARQADPTGGMPQPDQALPDGTKVYSMEGLQALLQWQAQNVESRVTKQVEQRYAPIEREWQTQQERARVIPIIQHQIAEAKKWPQFTENEAEITAALAANPQLSLEGAYRQVVFPRIVADRNKIRTEVLDELKKKPVATSAPVSASKPTKTPAAGKRDLTDIIAESIQGL